MYRRLLDLIICLIAPWEKIARFRQQIDQNNIEKCHVRHRFEYDGSVRVPEVNRHGLVIDHVPDHIQHCF